MVAEWGSSCAWEWTLVDYWGDESAVMMVAWRAAWLVSTMESELACSEDDVMAGSTVAQ